MAKQSLSVLVKHFGGYDALSVEEFPLREMNENDIEVSVHFCGINFSDLYTRKGIMADRPLPFVLGMECSGVVSAVGTGNHGFQVGQRVVCYDYMGGMYRKTVIVSADKCYPVPDGVDLKNAAAIFVTYMTAYFCLLKLGHLQAGEHVLINSCAGGVGCAAVQLAQQIDNVTLYGTASNHKVSWVKSFGVHHVIDYDHYEEKCKELCLDGFDLILDNQVGKRVAINQRLLKPLGRLIIIGANNIIKDEKQLTADSFKDMASNIPLSALITDSISIAGVHLGILAEKQPKVVRDGLNKVFEMFLQKKIKPVIDSVWDFENIVEATKLLHNRKNIGKVLLTTRCED